MMKEVIVFKPPFTITTFIQAFRVHQWIKNTLIFLPIFLAHVPVTFNKALSLVLAFFAMSFCASAVYIINDLFDLESDRRHSTKYKRPFASGLISIQLGIVLFLFSLFFSFTLSIVALPRNFTFVLIGYLISTSLYTLVLKKILIGDVIALSSFYALRIFAGSMASDVEISPWLLACSTFFFINLAFVKRYIELCEFKRRNDTSLVGRNYRIEDMQIILSAGITSGYLSVLIFFLYITSSEKVTLLYKNSIYLWLIGPILIYWLTRIWILAQRGELHSDPVHFAVTDFPSWVMGLLVLLLIVLGAVI